MPAFTYLWLFSRYSVNVPVGDQWDDVNVIRASYQQWIPWRALWAQHNENRMFFPNLLVIAQSRVTHFNIQIEELMGVLMLFVAVALLIVTHRRRSPSTPWLYYVPVAFLALTLTQYENTLWGFQIAWFMIMLALAVALYLVDRPSLTIAAFIGATAAAFVGSLSSSQGLLIWAAGFVLLYHRRRSWKFLLAWVVAAGLTGALYFHNLNRAAGDPYPGYAHSHPVQALKFYLFAIGDIVGVNVGYGAPGNNAVLAFGALLTAVGVGLLVIYGFRRDVDSASPIGLALIVVGLLFAFIVMEGRIVFGYWAASASRYTTFDILVPIGIYLTVLPRVRVSTRIDAQLEHPPEAQGAWRRIVEWVQLIPAWADRSILVAVKAFIAVAIVIQVVVSVPHGIERASKNEVYQQQAVPVVKHISKYSDGLVTYHLYIFSNAAYLRRQVATLKEHHLSVFATSIWP